MLQTPRDFGWNTPTVSNLSGAVLREHHCRQSAGVSSTCVVSLTAVTEGVSVTLKNDKVETLTRHVTCML